MYSCNTYTINYINRIYIGPNNYLSKYAFRSMGAPTYYRFVDQNRSTWDYVGPYLRPIDPAAIRGGVLSTFFELAGLLLPDKALLRR